jgi:hypothetical protein
VELNASQNLRVLRFPPSTHARRQKTQNLRTRIWWNLVIGAAWPDDARDAVEDEKSFLKFQTFEEGFIRARHCTRLREQKCINATGHGIWLKDLNM